MSANLSAGTVYVEVRPDVSNFSRQVGSGISSKLGGLASIATRAGKTIGIGLGVGLGAATVFGIKFDSQLEQANQAFTTLIGNSQEAKKFLTQLQQFAASTPFDFSDLIPVSQTLLAMGVNAKDAIPLMTTLGNITSAMGKSGPEMKQLAVVWEQIANSGSVHTQDVNQLVQFGIPAFQIWAKKSGESVQQVRDDLAAGKIDSDKFLAAIQQYSKTNFGDAMKKQSETFSGALSNLHDVAQQFLGKALKPLFTYLSKHAQELSKFLTSKEGKRFMEGMAQRVKTVIQFLIRFGGEVADLVGKLIDFAKVAIPAVRDFFREIRNSHQAQRVIADVKEAFHDLMKFAKIVGQYLIDNRHAIWIATKDAMIDLGTAIGDVVDALKVVFSQIRQNGETLIALTAGVAAAAIAWYAYSFAVWAADAAMTVAIASLYAVDAAVLILESPFLLVGIAIVAVVAAFVYLYRNVKPFHKIVNTALHAGLVVVKTVMHAIINVIRSVVRVVSDVVNLVGDLIHGRWSKLWGDAKKLVIDGLKALLQYMTGGFLNQVTGAAVSIGKAIYHGIKGALSTLKDDIAGILEGTINAVIDVVDSFGIHIHKHIFGHGVDFDWSPGIPHVALASGGIVNSPTVALIGEAGPEAVVPLSGRGQGALVGALTITNWDTGEGHFRLLARDEMGAEATWNANRGMMGR